MGDQSVNLEIGYDKYSGQINFFCLWKKKKSNRDVDQTAMGFQLSITECLMDCGLFQVSKSSDCSLMNL